ncbi:AI-2E family transporter [Horticoccus luteus]|uniref:AI-2E family transporter n=1 Tax=Horticoccus luteus TaxID=2862869 RepID=A0A8F9TV90_9BACT|nr:AI-2E family transporter [Horticoccus luteus]QYM78740.1 AI-2E family transporter [Horticoccus luteus]
MSEAAISHRGPPSLGRFAAYVGVTCAIVALFALSWMLRDVCLIAFGALVFAVAIRALASPLHRRLHVPEGLSVGIVVVLLVALALGLSWLFGRQIAAQLEGLGQRLPQAVTDLRAWVAQLPGGEFILSRVSSVTDGGEGGGGNALAGVQKFLALGATTLGHAVIMFFGGVFMAASPAVYRDGAVRLFPVGYRKKLHGALMGSGEALRKWLVGQLVSMICVGTLTGVGLAVIGAPLPLVLGIMAGLFNFIPILGPVLAFGPGVLVAFTDSPQTAVYAGLVYFLVQELEGHAITPLAQRWAVRLPPAVGLFAVLTFAMLFGFFGVLFGMPLAVVVMVLVRKLYVRDALEDAPPPPRRNRRPRT